MTKGTALHLGSGRGSFVLGGRDHRSATGTPLDAPPVDGVDAWMWAADFDELLTALGGPRRAGCAPAPSGATDSLPADSKPHENDLVLHFWDVQKHRGSAAAQCQPTPAQCRH